MSACSTLPATTATPPRRRTMRTRRPPPAPSNVLILVVPSLVLHSSLLPAFHAHFATYGTLHAWTPLPGLGRVVCVYGDEKEAQAARDEMDGFFWADEVDLKARGLDPGQAYEPLRAYYGPSFPPSRFVHLPSHANGPPPSSAASTSAADQQHLAVPSSGRNFLISPPGSPPVGWQQLEEDSPNTQTWHEGDEPPTPNSGQVELEELKKAASPDEAWADELARALRFLSVDVGGDEDEDDDQDVEGEEVMDEGGGDTELGGAAAGSTTHLVLAPAPIPSSSSITQRHLPLRPAVTVSSPAPSPNSDESRRQHPPTPPSTTATPPPGASKITSVKATVEAMLPRQEDREEDHEMMGGWTGGRVAAGQRFIPTARPPVH
ncbi:hypothetical protein JCM10908_004420 [Rhodotorula pacifica]|uniref:uncharacterized protein n=1 Tax=Rhodotorula pacifica TaxID=1495444 RepID=UPI0031742B48